MWTLIIGDQFRMFKSGSSHPKHNPFQDLLHFVQDKNINLLTTWDNRQQSDAWEEFM